MARLWKETFLIITETADCPFPYTTAPPNNYKKNTSNMGNSEVHGAALKRQKDKNKQTEIQI